MSRIVAPLVCKVQIVGARRESKYRSGEYYQPIMFHDLSKPETDPEAKFWKNLSDEESAKLTRDCVVQLVPAGKDKNGNDKHNIILMNAQPPAAAAAIPTSAQAPQASGWSAEEKRAIAAKVVQHADLLKFCLEQSHSKFSGLVQSEESIRCLATTLYLSAVRESR